MGKETPRIPSGKPSAFTVIRPKLTVSPYVKHILRRRRDARPPEDPSELLFNPSRLQLEQPWLFSMKSSSMRPTTEIIDIELADIQQKKKVNSKTRGKWVLDFTGSSQISINKFWTTWSDQFNRNPINGCNSTLKADEKCIYVYSAFEDCLQVFEVLRKVDNIPVRCEFTTPQFGILLRR